MRQNENRRVVGRLISPPAFPGLVWPWAPHRAEHVATENPRTNADKSLLCHVVVDARLPTLEAVHLSPCACVEEPLHELGPPHAEWILQVLIRPGAEAVDRNGEAFNPT